ncbi:uncharacterized protein LOC126371369 isoform X2 [Pectinophora gossypiella]|uniref:uncharacterized protein LOC126371369 isoform X2 n=1 Tax=Pectinophora gossypiella TaxID=13191 RepID=UPI00214E5336|nr:uncharacterized protein LOC126371369 isoform X2 [Pectinophora gossypiella]
MSTGCFVQKEDFTDLTRKYLLRTAVPRDIEQHVPIFVASQPGTSGVHSQVLTNITNQPAHGTIEQQELGQPGPSRSTNEACIEAGSRKPKMMRRPMSMCTNDEN